MLTKKDIAYQLSLATEKTQEELESEFSPEMGVIADACNALIIANQPGLTRINNPTIEEIVDVVARYTGLHKDQLIDNKKHTKLGNARHIIMCLAYECCYTYLEIAKFFGRHEHSATHYDVTKINNIIDANPKYDDKVNKWIRNIYTNCKTQLKIL